MRLLVLCFFFGAVCAAPQGYNYQVQIIGDSNGLSYDQLQALQQQLEEQQQQDHQQLAQQQQQLKEQLQAAILQQNREKGLPTITQHADNGGFEYTNQYQQQQQQQQQGEQVLDIGLNTHQQLQQQPIETTSLQSSHHSTHEAEPQPLTLPQVELQAPARETVPSQPTIPEHHIPAPQPHIPIAAPPVQRQLPPQPRYSTEQYNKEFYYLSAPQEDFELPQNVQQQLDRIKKNIRVVFIRAPEQNGITDAALQLAKQAAGGQTVIYVLSKQHDAGDLASKLQQVRGAAQRKPEVVFIKYRTPAEAAHAQRTIQAQYEALDGPNHFNHDGVAPTHDFIGSVGGGVDPRKSASASSAEKSEPSGHYLPPSAKV